MMDRESVQAGWPKYYNWQISPEQVVERIMNELVNSGLNSLIKTNLDAM